MTPEEFVKEVISLPEERREGIRKLLQAVIDYLDKENAPAGAATPARA